MLHVNQPPCYKQVVIEIGRKFLGRSVQHCASARGFAVRNRTVKQLGVSEQLCFQSSSPEFLFATDYVAGRGRDLKSELSAVLHRLLRSVIASVVWLRCASLPSSGAPSHQIAVRAAFMQRRNVLQNEWLARRQRLCCKGLFQHDD